MASLSYAGAMSRALVIAAALAALGAGALGAGCRDARLAKLREIRDEVCACKAPACGEAAMKRVPQEKVESDHMAQKIANEMLECLAKLYIADRPSTDPDAEVLAPEAGGSAGGAGSEGSAGGGGSGGSGGSGGQR